MSPDQGVVAAISNRHHVSRPRAERRRRPARLGSGFLTILPSGVSGCCVVGRGLPLELTPTWRSTASRRGSSSTVRST
jgi:hypothetical protein